MNTIKTSFILIAAATAFTCGGQTNKQSSKTDNNMTEEKGYVERLIDGGIEYSKDNILYKFKDGALSTVEQLNWGKVDSLPVSYDFVYSDTPKEIIITEKSGDKSQSETYIKISLGKTVFNHQYYSKEGQRIIDYETPTPVDIWIELSRLFNWDNFLKLKSGVSETEHDGTDITITVETESGIFSVTNCDGDTLQKFFKLLFDYRNSVYRTATDTDKETELK